VEAPHVVGRLLGQSTIFPAEWASPSDGAAVVHAVAAGAGVEKGMAGGRVVACGESAPTGQAARHGAVAGGAGRGPGWPAGRCGGSAPARPGRTPSGPPDHGPGSPPGFARRGPSAAQAMNGCQGGPPKGNSALAPRSQARRPITRRDQRSIGSGPASVNSGSEAVTWAQKPGSAGPSRRSVAVPFGAPSSAWGGRRRRSRACARLRGRRWWRSRARPRLRHGSSSPRRGR
jgi:hypothetical protein